MSDELKPCPFCGGKPNLHENIFASVVGITCTKCFTTQTMLPNRKKVIKKWNRRTP